MIGFSGLRNIDKVHFSAASVVVGSRTDVGSGSVRGRRKIGVDVSDERDIGVISARVPEHVEK